MYLRQFQADFFHKSSHMLQNVPQNVLKCNWIVVIMAMPLSNSIGVLVWVVDCWFPTKNIIFIIFDGSTALFRAVPLNPNLCNLRLYFQMCNNILQKKIRLRRRKQFCTLRALVQGLCGWYKLNAPLGDAAVILKVYFSNSSLGTLCEIILKRMPQNIIKMKSTMVRIMAWCHQAT